MAQTADSADLPPTLDYSDDSQIAAAALSRVSRRLLPFLCLLFIVNYLDRTNIAMAKLRMLDDAHLTEYTYGIGAGLFFVGYFLFEVPSNLILHRVGARRWIARIMITWGFISAAMLFTRGPLSFNCLRFALGIAEAGFFPGIVLYLTYWVPARRRAQVLAMFLTSTATSGMIGNPLAGWIMKMDGAAGLHGWQWVFLLEGLPPVLLGIGILVFPLLPDRPADAVWLTPRERQSIEQELRSDSAEPQLKHIAELRLAAMDIRLWLLSAIYFLLIMGLYGFVFWVPTLIKMFTDQSDARVGLLCAIPYTIAAISMVLIGKHADQHGSRRWHVAGSAAVGAVGVCAVAMSHQPLFGMLALCIAAIGIFGTLGPFWTIPTRYLRGTAAAGGIAVINSIGAMAGFVVSPAIGWAKTHTGHYTAGLLLVSASLAAGALLVLMVPSSADAPT
jgi:MFS family permease